eukprot:514040-Amphidinium_carterae.1
MKGVILTEEYQKDTTILQNTTEGTLRTTEYWTNGRRAKHYTKVLLMQDGIQQYGTTEHTRNTKGVFL